MDGQELTNGTKTRIPIFETGENSIIMKSHKTGKNISLRPKSY